MFVSLNHKRIRTSSSFLAQRPFARAIKIGFVLAVARKYTFVFPAHEISCVRVCASTCVYYRSFYTGFSQAVARSNSTTAVILNRDRKFVGDELSE